MSQIFLVVFFLFGFLASISDLRTRRIDNRLILAAFALALFGCGAYFVETFLGLHGIVWRGLGARYLPFSFYGLVLVHLALSVISALVCWRRRIWPAGDAKFFIVISFLVVLVRPDIPGFPYWVFFKLLVNTFIPAAVFISVFSVIPIMRWLSRVSSAQHLSLLVTQKISEWKRPANIYDSLLVVWNVLALCTLVRLSTQSLSGLLSGLFRLGFYMVFYLFFKQRRRIFSQGTVAIILLAFFLIQGIGYHRPLFLVFMQSALYGFGFMILLAGAKTLQSQFDLMQLFERPIRDIKAGDVLSDESWMTLTQICAQADIPFNLTRYADGLSGEDVALFQRSCPSALERKLQVFKTRPFAAWIFLGAVLTLYCHETALRWPLALIGIH